MTTATKDRIALVKRSQESPEWWIKNVLGVTLWDLQTQIARSVARNTRTTVRSCSSSGKSFDAACIALWFLYNWYPSTVITTAPTFRQVEDILWREISNRYAGSKVPLGGNLTRTSLNIEEKWFAVGLSTDEPERFQGFHNENVLVIGDEASGLNEFVYSAFENPLSSGNSHLLLIGNPTQQTGSFRDSFTSESYKQFHISVFDTPNFTHFGITPDDIKTGVWKDKLAGKVMTYPSLVTPQWVADRFTEWGEGSYNYQVYVMGNFPEAGINNLFRLSEVEGAVNRKVEDKGNLIAALDVSRYGDDESCYLLRQGNKVLKIETWGHQDTNYTAGRTIRNLREDKPATIRVDEIGVGGGVADTLKGAGFNVEMVNVGKPAIDTEKFINIRAEQYWLLSRRFADGTISTPDNKKLGSQLTDIRYTYTRKGQLQMESKEEMKARGSKSPDIADALMMGFISDRSSTGMIKAYSY
jgi:phage terminase large subunit